MNTAYINPIKRWPAFQLFRNELSRVAQYGGISRNTAMTYFNTGLQKE
jgi:hypothetical protein